MEEPRKHSRYSDWLRARRPRGRISSPSGVKNFLYSTSSRPALGSTQPPIRWVSGTYFPGLGARGSVVGWGTMLQAEKSPVRVPDEVDFSNWPNPSSRTMALLFTQPLTEMSTKKFPGGEKRPARRADNIAELNVWKCGSLNLSQP
jgi:hypothetical protein